MDTVIIGGKAYMYPANIRVNPITSVVPSDTEIIRIDFVITGGQTTINKLGKNDEGKLVVINHVVKQVFDLSDALNWCLSHGWTVRRWPGGARAWKHGLEPVRDAGQIKKLRDELTQHPRPELEGMGSSLDFAYDL